MGERGAKPALAEHREHRGRRMGEGSKLLAERPEDEVLEPDGETRGAVPRRVAEDEQPPGVLRRCAEQPLVVGIAAGHGMESTGVRSLDAGRVVGDVVQAPLRLLLEARLAEKDCRILVVGLRELEVDGAPRTPPQQFDLDLANSPADLEHGGALDPALLEELHHPLRSLVETALAIPRRHAASEAGTEEPIAAAGVAAARHARLAAQRYVNRKRSTRRASGPPSSAARISAASRPGSARVCGTKNGRSSSRSNPAARRSARTSRTSYWRGFRSKTSFFSVYAAMRRMSSRRSRA